MTDWRTARFLAVLGVVLAVRVPAHAQDQRPPGISFDGVARTGTDTRPVRFRFFCSSNDGPDVTGVLAVELAVPGYDQLHDMFDFDPFEGPDAAAGPLTLLQVNGTHATAADRFTASGSVVPFGTSEAFALAVSASRRDPGPLRRLAAVLRPLTNGAGRLVWSQSNSKPGGTPLRASLELTPARSEQLRTGLGPCVGIR